jgi:hypothetical protein
MSKENPSTASEPDVEKREQPKASQRVSDKKKSDHSQRAKTQEKIQFL